MDGVIDLVSQWFASFGIPKTGAPNGSGKNCFAVRAEFDSKISTIMRHRLAQRLKRFRVPYSRCRIILCCYNAPTIRAKSSDARIVYTFRRGGSGFGVPNPHIRATRNEQARFWLKPVELSQRSCQNAFAVRAKLHGLDRRFVLNWPDQGFAYLDVPDTRGSIVRDCSNALTLRTELRVVVVYILDRLPERIAGLRVPNLRRHVFSVVAGVLQMGRAYGHVIFTVGAEFRRPDCAIVSL